MESMENMKLCIEIAAGRKFLKFDVKKIGKYDIIFLVRGKL